MDDSQIEEVLSNIEATAGSLNYNRLSDTVALVICDTNQILNLSASPSNDRFYVINKLTPDCSAVGCVIDGISDLHWYIRPEHRGKGYLTRALSSTILKHIVQQSGRRCVRISIATDEYSAYSKQSEKVARSVGFRKVPVKRNTIIKNIRRQWFIYNPKTIKNKSASYDEKR